LASMICASPILSELDLRFVQAYQALRHQVGADGQEQLRQEAIDFQQSVLQTCGVPETGPVSGSADCVAAQYARQRTLWVSRLQGPAYEEATRPIGQHVALQAQLQKLDFLSAAAELDGVYGDATRAAIIAWQHANGRPETGFLGDADAEALRPIAGTPPVPSGATASPAASEATSPPPAASEATSPPPAASEAPGPSDQVVTPETQAVENRGRDTEIAGGTVVFILVFAFYFLPALIAASRHHHNAMAIFALNLLLGWTVLGWIAALIWSLTAVNRALDRSGQV
jgi:Superinfection immunity protein/Putative peptidoglycan binding domain